MRTRAGRIATTLRLLIVAVATTVATGLATPAAIAEPRDGAEIPAAAPGLPETVGADALPTWQVNGVVWSQAIVGNTVYVTGKFSRARPPGVARGGAGEVDAANLFAFDLRTGARVPGFSHALNGQGLVLRASPDGSRVYVGGDFTTVDGTPRAHVAAFDTATNALVAGFRPYVGGQVRALAVTADTVYLGGNFEAAATLSEIRSLAAFAVGDGAQRDWHPIVGGPSPVVYAMVVAPRGDSLVLGGGFDLIDGAEATGMGKVSLDGKVRPWAADERLKTSGLRGAITSVRTDGRSIFGTGMSYSDPAARFEGTFSANPDDGTIIWVNDCLGDSYDTAAMGGVVYSVHHNHDCRTIGEFGDTVPRSRWLKATAIPDQPRGTITELDDYKWDFRGLSYAGLLQWYPDLAFGTATTSGQAAWTVSAANGYVVLGGEFPRVNGTAQDGLTRFALPSVGPRLSGPSIGDGSTPALDVRGEGVRVSWTAGWDADDATLSYTVLRDGRPIARLDAASAFWHLPGLTALDAGDHRGSRYSVQVTDPDGNQVTSPESEPAGAATPETDYGAAVLADRPAHYWPMDGAGSVLADRAGGATVTGPVMPGRPGVAGAAIGAGAGTVLTGRATDRSTAGVTVEAWVRTSAAGGGRIIGRGSDAQASSAYRNDTVLYLDAVGRPAFATTPDKPAATTAVVGPVSVADGAWHHLVATAGDGSTQLWVDGRRVAGEQSVQLAQFAGYWRLLADSTANLPGQPVNAALAGDLDEVAVYPFVLDERAIARHHAIGTGSAPEPPPDAAIEDTFSRTESGGWGNADSGQPWTVSGFTSRWSVAGGAGVYLAGAGNGTPAVLGGRSDTGNDVTVTLGADKAPTGGGQFYSVVGRYLDADNGYSAKLRFGADGKVTGFLVRRLDSVGTDLASGVLPEVGAAANTRIRVRLQVVGRSPTTIRLKAWPAGSAEPAAWQLTDGDGTAALQAPGSVALHPYLAASATNAPVTMLADDLTVRSAQPPAPANQAPTARIAAGPSRITTEFDGSGSTDADGRLVSYVWSFGDGTTASGARVSHRYAEPGSYRVRLTVTDDDGAETTATKEVTDSTAGRDRFERVQAGGWGSAEIGGSWRTSGTASTWAVGAGAGTHRATPGGGGTAQLPVNLSSSEAQATITTDTMPSGSGQYLSLLSRVADRSDYRAKIRLTAAGAVQVYLCRTVNGVETILDSATVAGIAYRPGQRLTVRLQTSGTGPVTVRAKVWEADQEAPSSWTVTATDDGAELPQQGGIGLVTHVSASADAGAVFRIDDLWVGDPLD